MVPSFCPFFGVFFAIVSLPKNWGILKGHHQLAHECLAANFQDILRLKKEKMETERASKGEKFRPFGKDYRVNFSKWQRSLRRKQNKNKNVPKVTPEKKFIILSDPGSDADSEPEFNNGLFKGFSEDDPEYNIVTDPEYYTRCFLKKNQANAWLTELPARSPSTRKRRKSAQDD